MPAHTLMTTLKLCAACPLVLALATSTRAEQPSALPEVGTAVTTPQAAKPRATVGAYISTAGRAKAIAGRTTRRGLHLIRPRTLRSG